MPIVITADPLLNGFPSFVVPYIMKLACKSFADTNGNTQVRFSDNGSVLDPNGITNDAENLWTAIMQYAPTQPISVLAWSRGAQLVGAALRKHAADPDAPPAANLRFYLIGNPERAVAQGGRPADYINGSPLLPTPTNTQYEIWDIARKGDWFADAPESNVFTGLLVHCDYWEVDLTDLKPIKTTVIDTTTYYVVP